MVQLVSWVALCCPVTIAQEVAATQPARPAATSAPAEPEERLWREISDLQGRVPAPGPFPQRSVALRDHKQSLLSYVQLYQRLYPGGRHSDEAGTIELVMLYELGSLDGGRFDGLRQRVGQLLSGGTSPAVLHEAEYWKIQLDRVDRYDRVAATSKPSSAPVTEPDRDLLDDFERYVEKYPASRHGPRMVERLFFDALGAGRIDRCESLVGLMRGAHPDHPITGLLSGRLRREKTIGQPFRVRFESRPGHGVDTDDWRGKSVLVVVWLGADPRSRGLVREIDAMLDLRPDVRAIGVNLDETAEAMNAACRELGIDWEEWNDGHGLAHAFALEWGVREVPLIFVIDPAGRLRNVSQEGWREALRPDFIDTGGGGG